MAPAGVDENVMIWVAGGGIVLNGGIMLGLQGGRATSIFAAPFCICWATCWAWSRSSWVRW